MPRIFRIKPEWTTFGMRYKVHEHVWYGWRKVETCLSIAVAKDVIAKASEPIQYIKVQ